MHIVGSESLRVEIKLDLIKLKVKTKQFQRVLSSIIYKREKSPYTTDKVVTEHG